MLRKKLVIANRSEIACRIIRTARKMNLKVAVITTQDEKNSLPVLLADESLELSSFLNASDIVQKAKLWGADILHPGYGFLSENYDFAKMLEESPVTFVGPRSETIKTLANKEHAKKIARKLSIPTLNSVSGDELLKHSQSPKALSQFLKREELDFPLLIKAQEGGGGKGMRLVWKSDDLVPMIKLSSSEAFSSFGSKNVFLEKYLLNPRHIELQIFGDGEGGGLFLGERECSLQRRYQKIIEECPSPSIDNRTRRVLQGYAKKFLNYTQYAGAGTIEFLLDRDKNFYFLEVNTRLQVEHPVTEMVYGVDIVEAQLELALKKNVALFKIPEEHFLNPKSCAIEARVLCEDPKNNFAPTPGTIKDYFEKDQSNIRFDSGVQTLSIISPNYDSMISKVIACREQRTVAIEKLKGALIDYRVIGPTTNKPFLLSILSHDDFVNNHLSTHWIEKNLKSLNKDKTGSAAYLLFHSRGFFEAYLRDIVYKSPLCPLGKNFYIKDMKSLEEDDFKMSILRTDNKNKFYLEFRIEQILGTSFERSFLLELRNFISSGSFKIPFYCDRGSFYTLNVFFDDTEFLLDFSSQYEHCNPTSQGGDLSLFAPMASKVCGVFVKVGDFVTVGQKLFLLESMKMQFEILSKREGYVKAVLVEENDVLTGPDCLLNYKEEDKE